ncbi:MAG: hypothetical protein PHV74_02900 [Dehalococcoidia bacterium]|nr:hypothetical protein [Dehalococcoidia bacterium]
MRRNYKTRPIYKQSLQLQGVNGQADETQPPNHTISGRFPHRPSEPTGETLKGTVQFLKEKGADLAVCFDGDADRVVFCDRDGFLGFNEMVSFISWLMAREAAKRLWPRPLKWEAFSISRSQNWAQRWCGKKLGMCVITESTQESMSKALLDKGVQLVEEMVNGMTL